MYKLYITVALALWSVAGMCLFTIRTDKGREAYFVRSFFR